MADRRDEEITRYGDLKMNDSTTITFYDESFFSGSQLIVSSPNLTNLDFTMRSYWFTGSSSSWLLFRETNYTGNTLCLKPSDKVQSQGWGHTYSLMPDWFDFKSLSRVSNC